MPGYCFVRDVFGRYLTNDSILKELLTCVVCPVAALLGVLSATIVSFHSVSPTAAYLLVPYFGWTLYATGLTFAVYKMNPRVSALSLHDAASLVRGEIFVKCMLDRHPVGIHSAKRWQFVYIQHEEIVLMTVLALL